MAKSVSKFRSLSWVHLGGHYFRAAAPLFGSIRLEKFGDEFLVLYSVPGFSDEFVAGNFDSPQSAMDAAEHEYQRRMEEFLRVDGFFGGDEKAEAVESSHGWVGYNSGPCEWFWSENRKELEHELTDDIRPATHLERYLLNKQGNRTHENDDPAFAAALTNEQRELVLLQIVEGMGGTVDSSESKWSWLNWFCSDEVYGVQADTFNRCDEKGWLSTSHDTSSDTSKATITAAGRAILQAVSAVHTRGRPGHAAIKTAPSTRDGRVGEMNAGRAIYFLQRFKGEEKMLGPHEQWALDFSINALQAFEDAS